MRPRRFHRRLSQLSIGWLRFAAAAALTVLLSGLPQGFAELYLDQIECCDTEDECPSSDGEGHCPPDCTYGACAKTVSATLHVMPAQVGPAASVATVAPSAAMLAPSGVRGDVFHPPRSQRA